MFESCGRPMFPARGYIPIGHCGLHRGHDGYPEQCAILIETTSQAERDATRKLDLDLTEYWKPARDMPDDETPLFPIEDEE